ncbi:heavy metal-associated isoprenylated plant protein 6-like [Cynara cardunculus var. scolymus]|uniref:Heavy metal-associated domain, HMA n=1 Tax=Cynara cardunculus var. scolymus TaxID=59895 RepID=A0A103YI53_CYNCS|nr:heavy metal-associated isoprenylated plant protein 6-like [Cynara cardunculus var. scolymus]KVI09505.1 Heavy metal-associated domain, HMA [Cynara cardunculus var. scolymus]
MGEKDDTKKEAGEKKPADAGGAKKPDAGPLIVVLKVDLHCDGCAKKITKSIRQFEGVESVKADTAGNKLTVTGKVDPMRIKERVEYKTKKTVQILSPQPAKKEEEKDDKKPPAAKPDGNNADDKKPKEPQSSTVALKIPLHCDGCIHKIKRLISKIDGVESVMPDSGKDLVTVKGTMNVKELIPHLKEKLKRKVDVVPPKKEDKGGDAKDDKKVEGGGDKKEKAAGGGGGGDAKAAGGGGDDGKAAGGGGGGEDKNKGIEVINKFEHYGHNPYTHTMSMPTQMPIYNQNYYNQDYGMGASSSHGYVQQGYNYGYPMEYPRGPPMPPPMYLQDTRVPDSGMFSDENPNACSLM